MIDILPESYKNYKCQEEEYQSMISFDCRGVEILKWEWKGTEGLFATVEDGETFEIDLQEEEWTDYSEKTEQSIGVYKIYSKVN